MKKIYVGCALTDASEEFKQSVEEFKNQLRGEYEILDFVGLTAGTAADVYNWDIGKCVATCDAFIAVCDLPSIGLGCELNEAMRLGTPVIAIANEESKVTRLVLGMAEVQENVTFERYSENLGNALLAVKAWLTDTFAA
nr:Unknown Function [uncultured bacterium]